MKQMILLWSLTLGGLHLAGCGKPATGGPSDHDGQAPTAQNPTERPEPTFNRDIAPIVFENCSVCHHPGGAGPFSLLAYDDLRSRVWQVVTVTSTRYMPPWLPEAGYGEFRDQRGLTDEQIATIRRWADASCPEGDPADLPTAPVFPDGWQLGEPDMVVAMPEEYTLVAEGRDVFRNFVLPVDVAQTRYVQAVEVRPGNALAVHHATLLVDETRSSRQLDAEETETGFGGMEAVRSQAHHPSGNLVGWTPGKVPHLGNAETAWPLRPGDDLVMQLHMPPTGKPERIRSSVGLYFSPTPPTRVSEILILESLEMDIAPGVSDYRVRDDFRLPIDVEIQAIYPHAHYLGKQVWGYATLPSGEREWLIRIDDWDFNWQDEYHYARPVQLPKGSTLTMEITYDNTSENVRNPHHPPRRVIYGPESTDEMARLFIQVLPKNDAELPVLLAAYHRHRFDQDILFYEKALEANPEYAGAHHDLGVLRQQQGQTEVALTHFRKATELDPDFAIAHRNLGRTLAGQGDFEEGTKHLREAIRLLPHYAEAHNDLGAHLARRGLFDQAIPEFEAAVAASPTDPTMRKNLAKAHNDLGIVFGKRRDLERAVKQFQLALEVSPNNAAAHQNLARLYAMQGKTAEAKKHQEAARRQKSQSP